MTERWSSPAKVNLALLVVGERPDGFHEIRTVFQAIDLADTVTLERTREPRLQIACDHPRVPQDDTNLVARAHALLVAEHGIPAGFRITIEKRIPPGAGLGGGSSNAAATLAALNALCGLGLEPEALEALAARLGSDAAFFVRGGTRLGTGRGEHLTDWPAARRLAFLLALPELSVATAAVYRRGGFILTPDPDPLTILSREMTREDPEGVARGLFNALEGPAFSLHPALARLKGQILGSGALGALLSGSGACVFGLFADVDAANAGSGAFTGAARTLVARPLDVGVRRLA